MLRRRLFVLAALLVIPSAVAQLAGCEGDQLGGSGIHFGLDGSTFDIAQPDRGVPVLDSGVDAVTPIDAAPEASPDASFEAHPIYGIWTGTLVQSGVTYPVLVGVVPGAAGQVIGTVEYPTLGCGGTYRLVEPLGPVDAGADADADAGGWLLRGHELDRTSRCVANGDTSLLLQPDGGVWFEWKGFDIAAGPLTRVGSLGPPGSHAGVVWGNLADGGVDGGGLHPLIGVITREEPDSGPAGVFSLLSSAENGGITCGGLWTVASRSATELVLVETIPEGAIGCVGAGTVRLAVDGDRRRYERRDAGSDSGPIDGGDVTLILERIGP